MPRGGKREGAGRTPDDEEAGAMVTISIKVHPAVPDRLRRVAATAGKTQAEVLDDGIDANDGKTKRSTVDSTEKRGR